MSNSKDPIKYPTLILELTDRRASSYIMKGTEGTENEDRLDTSSQFMLYNGDVAYANGKAKKIRWIRGFDSPFLEDQTAAEIEYNPQRDVIVFEMGRFSCRREGETIGLYDYLKLHNGNITNENRREEAEPIFREINTAVDAEERIFDLADESKATSFLATLQTRKGKVGSYTYEYKSDKIAWLCKLFNISSDSDAERLEALVIRARFDPVTFNDIREDVSSDVKVQISIAKDAGIIIIGNGAASFQDDGKVICRFKAKKDKDIIDEIAEFLMSSAGEVDKSILHTKLEHFQDKDTEVK